MTRRKPKKHRRKRILSDGELRAVWMAAEDLRAQRMTASKQPIALKIFAGLVHNSSC